MTVTAKPLIEAKSAETAQTTQYTAPTGTRCIVDKCTATNGGATSATISINVVAAGDTAGAGNLVLKAKALAAGECYVCPEIVGQVLAAGDSLSTLASATGIVIRASGREVT